MPRLRLAISLIVLLCVSQIVLAQSQVLKIDANTQDLTVWGKNVELLGDPSEKLTLKEAILSPNFKSTQGVPQELGYVAGHFWIRFKIQKNTTEPISVMLRNDYTMVEGLDYYLLNDVGQVVDSSNIAKSCPTAQRRLTVHQCAFPLKLKDFQTYTVYLKYMGTDAKRFQFRITELHRFYQTYLDQLWYWAGHVGFVIAIIMVQLIFWLVSHGRHFQLYFWNLWGYLAVVFVGGYGFIDNWLWPNSDWLRHYAIVFATLGSSVLAVIFYANVLRLKKLAPFFYKLSWAFVWLVVFGGAAIFVFSEQVSPYSFTSVVSSLFFLITMISCIASHLKGNKNAIYYFFGTLFFMIGSILNLCWTEGMIEPDWWVINAFYLGSSLEMCFFTWALANNYKVTRRQRESAQHELIETLQTQNKEISDALLRGQTMERKRVAADLHDSFGGTLSALNWSLASMNPEHLEAEEKEIYNDLVQMTNDAHQRLRFLSHNLLPEDLENEGLAVAMNRLFDKLNRRGKTSFMFKSNLTKKLDTKVEFELYNVCIELVNNVLKHADASKATLELLENDNKLTLSMADNGKGITNHENVGKGLTIIEERIASINGTLHINSTEDGTIIKAEIKT